MPFDWLPLFGAPLCAPVTLLLVVECRWLSLAAAMPRCQDHAVLLGGPAMLLPLTHTWDPEGTGTCWWGSGTTSRTLAPSEGGSGAENGGWTEGAWAGPGSCQAERSCSGTMWSLALTAEEPSTVRPASVSGADATLANAPLPEPAAAAACPLALGGCGLCSWGACFQAGGDRAPSDAAVNSSPP